MKFQMHLKGGAELAAALNAISKAVRRKALYAVLRDAAEPMRARAAQLAPYRPGGRDIREHIGISTTTRIGSVAGGQWQAADEFQAAVAIGPTQGFFYGLYQEYGTVRHAAHAFMRPAFDETRDPTLFLIRDGLWKLMEHAAAREGKFRNVPMEGATP